MSYDVYVLTIISSILICVHCQKLAKLFPGQCLNTVLLVCVECSCVWSVPCAFSNVCGAERL